MAQVIWTSSTSGNWTTAADWSGGAVPGAGDDVLINVPNVTVTVNSGSLAVNSITTTSSILSVAAGAQLAIANGGVFGGNYQQSGGTVSFGGQVNFNDAFTESGGSLSIASGADFAGTDLITGGIVTSSIFATFTGAYQQNAGTLLLDYRGGSFAGTATLAGGVIADQGQSFTSGGGFTQTGGTLSLSGFGGTFNGNLDQAGGVISLQSGQLDLAGAVTTLSGTVAGYGTLVAEGAQNGLNGTTTIGSATVLSIGKVDVISGVFALAQASQSYSYAYGGYFYSSNQGTVALGGNTLVLNGRADLGADISGAGTLVANGGAQINGLTLNNSATLTVASAVALTPVFDQAGTLSLLNNAAVIVNAGASLRFTGNDTINDASGNGTLLDNGLLTRTSGAGTTEILPSITESSGGSIAIAVGTMDFSGLNDSFAGSISGAGTFSIGADYRGQPTTFTITNASASSLSVGNFTLTGQNAQDELNITNSFTYAGHWDQSGGLFVYGNTGQTPHPTLTLTGSVILEGGVIKSSTGTIDTTGLVSLGNTPSYQQGIDIEGFTNFLVNKEVSQDTSMQLGAQSGSKPLAVIEAGATWYLEDAASITGAYGSLTNSGTLDKSNGSGVSSIDGTLTNKGTLIVAASQLLLDGSGVLTGHVTGAGQLDFEGNGTYLLENVGLTVGHVLVDNTPNGQNASVVMLGSNVGYGGTWAQHGGTVSLADASNNPHTLTLTGVTALDGGSLTGPGTLVATGATTLGGSQNSQFTIGSSAELDLTKLAEQSTNITLGSLGNLNVAATSTFTLDDNVSIFGNGTLTVEGAMNASGTGTTSIYPATVDAGKITSEHGVLVFLGAVSGSGSIIVDNGAAVDFENSVSSSTTVSMAGGNASMLIGDAPAYNGIVSGFVTGDFIEFQQLSSGQINDSLNAAGTVLTISDSSQHTFTVTFAQPQTLSGTGSLVVADGPNGLIGVYHT